MRRSPRELGEAMERTLGCLAGAALLALAACGGEGDSPDALVEACESSSNIEQQLCECVARKAGEDLSPTSRAFLIASLQGDEARVEELRGELTIEEAARAARYMTGATAECAEERLGGEDGE